MVHVFVPVFFSSCRGRPARRSHLIWTSLKLPSPKNCAKKMCTCNTRMEISNSRTLPEYKHIRMISGCGIRRNLRISEFCNLHANDTCISFTLSGKAAKSAKLTRFRNFWERRIPKNAYMLILWQRSRIRDLHARMTCAHNFCTFPISNCSLRLETCKKDMHM